MLKFGDEELKLGVTLMELSAMQLQDPSLKIKLLKHDWAQGMEVASMVQLDVNKKTLLAKRDAELRSFTPSTKPPFVLGS